MKKNNFIKNALVALSFAVAVAVMIPAAGSVEAQAAKTVTAQKNWKKAKAVKTGTTVVNIKAANCQESYVKFKAPKAGTYKITFSNLKTKGVSKEDFRIGFFTIAKKAGSGLTHAEFNSNAGKTNAVMFASKYAMTTSTIKDHNKKEAKRMRYSATPYAKIKLKKGEIIYITMFSLPDKQACSYTVKIKK